MKKNAIKAKPQYKRILIKLSGETLQNRAAGESLDEQALDAVARQVRAVHQMGVEVGIVLGGGNIFRGMRGLDKGIDRAAGDTMGMLATIINSLAVATALEKAGVPARAMVSRVMPAVAELFIREKAIRHLQKGRVVVFGGGTGNPFFTTDSAAALRASEIGANVVLKATKVDGIYTADPMKDPTAKRFDRITFHEALVRQLKVMDAAAFSLCMENNIPIIVFNFFKEGELARVVCGKPVGTLVHAGG